jgi:putative addiction module component (TIGR02574 family)
MPELNFKLRGWQAVAVIIIVVCLIVFRIISFNDLTSEAALVREIETHIASEYMPAAAEKLKAAQVSGVAQELERLATSLALPTTIDQIRHMLSVYDMATLLDKASEAAFSLPRKERAALVHALIQSLDEAIDEGVEPAWQMEINRRLNAVEAGQTSERDAFIALDCPFPFPCALPG